MYEPHIEQGTISPSEDGVDSPRRVRLIELIEKKEELKPGVSLNCHEKFLSPKTRTLPANVLNR